MERAFLPLKAIQPRSSCAVLASGAPMYVRACSALGSRICLVCLWQVATMWRMAHILQGYCCCSYFRLCSQLRLCQSRPFRQAGSILMSCRSHCHNSVFFPVLLTVCKMSSCDTSPLTRTFCWARSMSTDCTPVKRSTGTVSRRWAA